ncbi:MAG: hypothetical protein HQL13_08860, partial [Candidatus Omnitrophica bacterium]|nr:hypothetical protein [Candidatus Omnitrophota bacterium]
LIGIKKDKTVVDIAVDAKKTKYGISRQNERYLMRQLGVVWAGILDQGNTVRVAAADGQNLFIRQSPQEDGKKPLYLRFPGVPVIQQLVYTVNIEDTAKVITTAPPVPGALIGSDGDNARLSNAGGIDLTRDKLGLQVVNADKSTGFQFDPQMIKQLQNATGFVPIIIDIHPMTTTIPAFLGLSDNNE